MSHPRLVNSVKRWQHTPPPWFLKRLSEVGTADVACLELEISQVASPKPCATLADGTGIDSVKEHRMPRQLVREYVGEEWYEYIPLGKFVVSAPAVCRGRPTFKNTRIEVAGVLERLGAGALVESLIADSGGPLSREAIAEAARLAAKALIRQVPAQAGTA